MSKRNRKTEGPRKSVITSEPFPASRKIHVQGKRHKDIRVAMREINVSSASNGSSNNGDAEKANKPLVVYDTSGPYTDPTGETNIRKGLVPLRL